jgi:G:T/U-mismatch repair DNA glycosylase
MILIGSRALSLRCSLALRRKPVDFDWVCTQEEFDTWMETSSAKVNPTKVYPLPDFHKMIVEGSTNCEFEIMQPGTSSELLRDLVEHDKDSFQTPFGWVPTVNLLFTIKDSHKYKKFQHSANGFWKTAMDWHTMKRLGAQVLPEYQAFAKLRQEEAYAGQKHPKLNVSKDAFFKDDSVEYRYDHDDIHRAVMKHERPAYEYYLAPGEQVKCSKDSFFQVSEDIRLHGAVQEAVTLALERSLIPHPGVWTPDFAFKFAYAKVCTSITSGFFRKYCFENLPQAIRLYNEQYTNYHQSFLQALEAGKVKPFTGSKY